jgi:phospholipid/cholesterol/gamma-HCH transport system substrate-binding protein
MIGSNQNMFGKTFQIHAVFYNVNGLMKGNNVRLAGIDVGTIQRVEIINDTSVNVTMIVEESVHPFIKNNSVASVGTDGLMGNKLVNIVNNKTPSNEIIQQGGVLLSIQAVETDQMLRTLDQTNVNLYHISDNLRRITQKLNNNNSLWSILMDTTVAQNVKRSISNIRNTTKNTSTFTADLNYLLNEVKNGKGLAGSILHDTTTAKTFNKTIQQLHVASERAAQITEDLKKLTDKMKKGQGGAGVLMNDSAFAADLKKSMHNVQTGSERFSQDMEALKHNFLLRGYFKKLEKERAKSRADSLNKIKAK